MTTKKTRIKHSPEFKAETLKLAEKVGVAAAARQLSLHESQIYGWRKNSKKDTNTSQREIFSIVGKNFAILLSYISYDN